MECTYNDTTFKDCVLSKNCTQILHQAFITGFTVGVYIVSKERDGVGKILQVVILIFQNRLLKITKNP